MSPHAVLSSSVETFRIKLDLLQELKSLLCNFAHTDTAEGMAIAVSAITSCFELNIFPPATRTSAVNAETMAMTITNSTKEKPCCFIFL
ncbi:hypothetical protein AZO1586I_2271 [Bathymodiolus thermophilus thioautotrophic gill symbiont]|uniref:Uncharacterized protein n=1 Tax=Bathymodiolus thermophilus thioautotrophic gill symbiont TaxID=2360 RepID=A0ABN7GFW4_9GAMM|nr:hypothetical protein AZO1586I_2271 [Bathymodiolus thermophilus thioautotrophic gill symbiont]